MVDSPLLGEDAGRTATLLKGKPLRAGLAKDVTPAQHELAVHDAVQHLAAGHATGWAA